MRSRRSCQRLVVEQRFSLVCSCRQDCLQSLQYRRAGPDLREGGFLRPGTLPLRPVLEKKSISDREISQRVKRESTSRNQGGKLETGTRTDRRAVGETHTMKRYPHTKRSNHCDFSTVGQSPSGQKHQLELFLLRCCLEPGNRNSSGDGGHERCRCHLGPQQNNKMQTGVRFGRSQTNCQPGRLPRREPAALGIPGRVIPSRLLET